MAVEKVTFTLPETLVRRLERIPSGRRSMVVGDAIARELDRQAAVDALRGLREKPIWKKRYHRRLRGPRDFARYRAVKSRLAG